MEGYRLSISIGTKITYPTFIDDLQLYTSSEANLNSYKTYHSAMQHMGLYWNPKKCNVINARGRSHVHDAADLRLDQTAVEGGVYL